MKSWLIVAIIFISLGVQAQGIQLGLGLGKSVYWGDLNAPEFSSNLSNNGELLSRYMVNTTIEADWAWKQAYYWANWKVTTPKAVWIGKKKEI